MTNFKTISILQGPARTSSLMAPIMLLQGHPGEIFSLKFHPDGQFLVSSGFDRQICKYNISAYIFCNLTIILINFHSFMECLWRV